MAQQGSGAALPPGAALTHACATRHGPRSYIVPTYPTVEPFARRFYPADLGPITDIPPTGNAPVLLTRADLLKIIPLWAQARRAPRRQQQQPGDAALRVALSGACAPCAVCCGD